MSKYLCIADPHLSAVLQIPPAQLSSERVQRKQQNQGPEEL